MIYYYEKAGQILAGTEVLAGFTPVSAPTAGPIFFAIHGDPVLGRGSFKVAHPGQLANPHGLEVLDASRLPAFEADEALTAKMNEYNTDRTCLAEEFNKDLAMQDKDVIESLKAKMDELAREINGNENYTRFAAAQQAVNDLMKRINETISRNSRSYCRASVNTIPSMPTRLPPSMFSARSSAKIHSSGFRLNLLKRR